VRPYHVTPAYGGQEALALLQRQKPDLVLLDLALADLPGEALIQAIRANPEWCGVRIVVVSGQDDVDPRGGLAGPLVMVKANGLTSAEIVHWTRQALNREGGVLDWSEELPDK
jgi:CheY-like chemotaxis protein